MESNNHHDHRLEWVDQLALPGLLLAAAGAAIAIAVATLTWPAVSWAASPSGPAAGAGIERREARAPGGAQSDAAAAAAVAPRGPEDAAAGAEAEVAAGPEAGSDTDAAADAAASEPASRSAREEAGGPRVEAHFDEHALGVPESVLARLSPEEITTLLLERERQRGAVDPDFIVPLIFFVALVLIILLVQYFGARRERLRHETLRAMVERGVEIPPDLIAKRRRPESDLRRGLTLVATGLGLVLFFAFLDTEGEARGIWSIGLIPMLIGGGYLLAWRLESKSARAD